MTATVVFQNRSSTGLTYSVILDGVQIAVIPPGSDTGPRTVTANVQHTVFYRVTNTNSVACGPATPVWPQCTANTLFCTT